MFLLLTYLISIAASTISYEGTTLTIDGENSVTKDQVSKYTSATALTVTTKDAFSVDQNAFQGFDSLATVSITASSITIQTTSFNGCKAIKSVTFNAPTLTISPGAFSSAASLSVIFKGANFNAEMASFVTSNIEEFNIDVTGAANFKLEAALQSHVKRIIVKANTISFEQQSFQQAKGIELLQADAKETIDFKLESFLNAQVSQIQCTAGKAINLEQQTFQEVSNIEILNLTSGGTISFKLQSFISSSINDVIINAASDVIIAQQAMQKVSNFNSLTVISGGKFSAELESFIGSSIHEIYIKCNGTAIFTQQCYQNTPDLENLTIIANGEIRFELESFIQSNVTSMQLYTNSSVYFAQQAFQNTYNLSTFEIHAMGTIDFELQAFIESNINAIELYTNSSINFAQQSFQDCTNLTSLVIHSPASVTFGLQAFINSQISELNITYYNETSGAVYLANSNTITFDSGSFQNCNQLKSVSVNTKGNVEIKSNSFQNSKALSKLNVKAGEKATVEGGAFAGCESLGDNYNIDAPTKIVADDAFNGNSGDNKGHKSSSHKDDDGSQSSAKTLNDFKIQTVYLGVSPNIIVNLNFFASLMRAARKTFGKIIPSPDLIHSAIWIGQKDATDDSVGAIFVYGRYFNKLNSPAYLSKDGAKAYVMTLREFKNKYPSIDPMKLNPHKNINLHQFIKEVQESGKWGASDYNWPTNNCQHFTAKLIDLLQATRNVANNDDWIDLPKPVLQSLKSNEQKEK